MALHYAKVRPRLLEEQAKKGSLSAQWELEHHAAKEAWILERVTKQAERAKKGSLAAQWELENNTARETWMLQKTTGQQEAKVGVEAEIATKSPGGGEAVPTTRQAGAEPRQAKTETTES